MNISHSPSLTFQCAAESDVLALPLECLQMDGSSSLYAIHLTKKGFPGLEIGKQNISAKEEEVVQSSSRWVNKKNTSRGGLF